MQTMSTAATAQGLPLQVNNLAVVLGGQRVLDKVEFSVTSGETLVFIGPSGHGKTVLFKTLAGIFEPASGEVLIDNLNFHHRSYEKRRELAKKLGFLFQRNALFDFLTSIENVMFPLREHLDASDEDLRRRAMDCLQAVGLEAAANKYPFELSGGMQKRLGIARTIALQPSLVFYDDPTAGQDPIRSDQIAELIHELKGQNGATVLTATNDLAVAFRLADRILMVVEKQVLDLGPPEQVPKCPDPRVQQFLHGRPDGPLTQSPMEIAGN